MSGLTVGKTALYECDSSFRLVGDSSRTCQNNSTWSGLAPTCVWLGEHIMFDKFVFLDIFVYVQIYDAELWTFINCLSHGVASVSDKTPCIKIDKQQLCTYLVTLCNEFAYI